MFSATQASRAGRVNHRDTMDNKKRASRINDGNNNKPGTIANNAGSMIDFIKEDNKNAPAVIDNNRTTVRDALQRMAE
jgi:hypothetical protein